MFKVVIVNNKDSWNNKKELDILKLDKNSILDIKALKMYLKTEYFKNSDDNNFIKNLHPLHKGKFLINETKIDSINNNSIILMINDNPIIKDTLVNNSNLNNRFRDIINSNFTDNSNINLINTIADILNISSGSNNLANNQINTSFTSNLENLLNSYSNESSLQSDNTDDSESSLQSDNTDDSESSLQLDNTDDSQPDDSQSSLQSNINDDSQLDDSQSSLQSNITQGSFNYTPNNTNNFSFLQNIINTPFVNNISSLRDKHKDKLEQLQLMGFNNENNNIEALEITNGNVEQAINILLSNL